MPAIDSLQNDRKHLAFLYRDFARHLTADADRIEAGKPTMGFGSTMVDLVERRARLAMAEEQAARASDLTPRTHE